MDTDTMMPPALLPDETDEQARQRRLAGALNSPGFRDTALSSASRPAIAGTDRGNALPERDASDSDSRELYQRALTSVKAGTAAPASVAGAANSSEGTSRNTMPPVNLLPNDEDDRQRRLARISGMMPPVSPQPSSQPAGPALPPITASPIPSRSDASTGPLPLQPLPPVSLGPPAPAASPANAMPPITLPPPRELQPSGRDYSGAGAAPVQPGATPLPPVPSTATQQSLDLLKQKPPNETLPWWKQILAQVGQALPFGKAVERAIPGSELNYESKLNQTAMRAAKEQTLEEGRAKAETDTPAKRAALIYEQPSREQFKDMTDFEKNEWRLTGKLPPSHEHAKLADLYSDAVRKAAQEGRDPLQDADVKRYGDAIQNLQREPADRTGKTPEETTIHDLMTGENGQPRVNRDTGKPYTYLEAYGAVKDAAQAGRPEKTETPFNVWRKQHPNADVSDYFKLQPEARNEARPPKEQPHLTPGQKATLTRRYKDSLAKIEQEFRQRQSGTYVDRQSGEQLPAMTQDELNQRKQEAEDAYKDELEAAGEAVTRYDYGSENANAGAAQSAASANARGGNAAPQHKVGDEVMYQGKRHRITAIQNGKATLAPLGGR